MWVETDKDFVNELFSNWSRQIQEGNLTIIHSVVCMLHGDGHTTRARMPSIEWTKPQIRQLKLFITQQVPKLLLLSRANYPLALEILHIADSEKAFDGPAGEAIAKEVRRCRRLYLEPIKALLSTVAQGDLLALKTVEILCAYSSIRTQDELQSILPEGMKIKDLERLIEMYNAQTGSKGFEAILRYNFGL